MLFFDEIQACIPAISSLRFFYEKLPDLDVISAGSLLEFALSEIPSFGVGRIRSMFLYPLSFDEFLKAMNEDALLVVKQKANDLADIILEDDFNVIDRSAIAEQFVGLELLKSFSCYRQERLFYWQREAKSSNAEVDYLIQKDAIILPIEVKSGSKGSMQSLRLFMDEKKYDGHPLFLGKYNAIEFLS